MSFPQYVSDAALSACGRHCCICHKFCGTKIELHHIKQAAFGGEDTFENCIPLCFDCHADMGKADPKHNKGKRYTEAELKMHRDKWYQIVANGSTLISKQPIDSPINNEVYEEDRTIFAEICESFSAKIRDELSSPGFYYPYERNMFNPLNYLTHKSDDPAYFFINQELEEMRSELFESIDRFTDYLYSHTYPVDSNMPDKNAPHAWLLNHGYIREPSFQSNRDRLETEYGEEVAIINRYASELWNTYSKFVKRGRVIINGKTVQ